MARKGIRGHRPHAVIISLPYAARPGGAPLGGAEFQAALAEARRRYQSALQAQRAGDWARYGEEIRQLGELLEQVGGGGSPRPR